MRNDILGRVAVIAAIASGLMLAPTAVAKPAVIAEPMFTPDFSGFWKLAPEQGTLKNPAIPGPHGLSRGWMTMGGWANNPPPPLTAEGLDRVRESQLRETNGEAIDERSKACLPSTLFDAMTHAEPIDIVQRQDAIAMVSERELAVPRRVFIAGPQLPAAAPKPSVNGHAVGRWEGDTLVIETAGFEPDSWLFLVDYIPHTADLRVTERLHLELGGERLIWTATFTDPVIFSEPWTVEFRFARVADMEALESVCDRDNRGLWAAP